jgi:hypothetical protein
MPPAGKSEGGERRSDKRGSAEPEVFRLGPPVVVWWVWLVFAAANLADLIVQASWGHFTAVVTAILVTLTGVAYACALRPRVIADEVGLTVRNPFRDYRVPWSAIRDVDGGDWVRVHCGPGVAAAGDVANAGGAAGGASADGGRDADGGGTARTIYCWALFVPARARIKAARRARGTGPAGLARLTGRQARVAAIAGIAGPTGGYAAGPPTGARLPEARRLASLPAALAIAERLDTRARRERARGRQRAAPSARSASAPQITAAWAWRPLAAIVGPAIALVIVALT